MTRVDDIYKDLELLIYEHKVYQRVIDENIRLTNAIEDIKAEIEAEKESMIQHNGTSDLGLALEIIDKHIRKENVWKHYYIYISLKFCMI